MIMYAYRSTALALVILAGSVAADAREPRNMVLRCPPTHRPMAAEIAFAIEISDYSVSPKVQREMLAHAHCLR
jgi:hypothetical protein